MAQTAMIEKTVYEVTELSATAFETAWAHYADSLHDWWDFVYEDFMSILEILGFEVKSDNIEFSGFSHQGSYAAFSGRYYFRKEMVKKIKDYAPEDKELHNIAKVLSEMQRKCFYSLSAKFTYSNYHGYSIDMEDGRRGYGYLDANCDAEDVFRQVVKDLSAWLYKQLEKSWEYISSKEAFIDCCQCNDYTFNENGKLDFI